MLCVRDQIGREADERSSRLRLYNDSVNRKIAERNHNDVPEKERDERQKGEAKLEKYKKN